MYIQQIYKFISKFLWNGNKTIIKHSIHQFLDFISKLKAIKLAWVHVEVGVAQVHAGHPSMRIIFN